MVSEDISPFGAAGTARQDAIGFVAREEFPEETRSVCSIANHMEHLGRDSSDHEKTVLAETGGTVPETSDSANNTSTSSSLDTRIQALSDMNAEERCTQLNQDAIAAASKDVPMEADFLNCSDDDDCGPANDTELQGLLHEANARAAAVEDSEMPDLEGSEIDFEAQ